MHKFIAGVMAFCSIDLLVFGFSGKEKYLELITNHWRTPGISIGSGLFLLFFAIYLGFFCEDQSNNKLGE